VYLALREYVVGVGVSYTHVLWVYLIQGTSGRRFFDTSQASPGESKMRFREGQEEGREEDADVTAECSGYAVGPMELRGRDLCIILLVVLYVFPDQDSIMYASTRQKELYSTCLYALHHSTGMYMHSSQGVMRAFPREYSCKYRKWSGAFGCRVWGVGTRYPNKSDIVSHLFSELRLYLAVLAASFHRAYSSAAYFAPA